MTRETLADIDWWRERITLQESQRLASEKCLESILDKCDHRRPSGRSALYATGTFSKGCPICGRKDM